MRIERLRGYWGLLILEERDRQERGTVTQRLQRAQSSQRRKQGLDGVVFHGWGEARDALAGGGAFDLDAELLLVFGTGFAKNDDGAEGFVIDAGDEVGFAGVLFFPKLANLYLARGHSDALNVDRLTRSVNCLCGGWSTVRVGAPLGGDG